MYPSAQYRMQAKDILQALEHSNLPFLISDREGTITYVSPSIEALTGYEKKDLVGAKTRIFRSGEEPASVFDHLWETILSGLVWSGTLLNRKKSGGLYKCHVSIHPIKEPNGTITGFLSFMGSAEQGIRGTRFQERNERLAAFLDKMSYEFRMVLNSIMGFNDLLHEDLQESLDEAQKEYFTIISNSTKRLLHALDDSLLIARLEAGAFGFHHQHIQVAKEMKAILLDFSPMFDHGQLRLIKVIEDNGALIDVDPQLFTIMMNGLLINAYKFTMQGTVTVGLETKDNKVVISVIDTGVGMSEKFKPVAFEPFEQEEIGYSAEYEGTGLGLALIKHITESMNGTIRFESEKNQGSAFVVTFPITGWQKGVS